MFRGGNAGPTKCVSQRRLGVRPVIGHHWPSVAALCVGQHSHGMSKKVYCVAVGCFLGGLVLGVGGTYLCGMAYWGKQTGVGLALIKEMEIAECGQRAFVAYQHETPQVAIYALNQYLNRLKKAENRALPEF